MTNRNSSVSARGGLAIAAVVGKRAYKGTMWRRTMIIVARACLGQVGVGAVPSASTRHNSLRRAGEGGKWSDLI